MAWLTENEFKSLYVTESATEISSAQISQCLDEGIDEIALMCGEDVLTEIENAVSGSTDRKVKKFRRAQGKLAYRALLLVISSRFRSGGVLESERDINSSMADKYESFDKVEKRREVLKSEAAETLKPYLIVDVSGDELGPAVEFSHPAQDKDCYESGICH